MSTSVHRSVGDGLPYQSVTRSRSTLTDVAKRAVVSESTASKALNGRSGVSPKLRTRVEQAAAEVEYRRPYRSTAPGGLIELIVDRMDSQWSLDVFRGIQRVVSESRTAIIVTERAQFGADESWINGIVQRQPRGVILALSRLTASSRHQLEVRGIPFVMIDPIVPPDHDVASVGSANREGGSMAARHLIALGHQRIASVTVSRSPLFALARQSGFSAALEEAGLASDLVISTGATREDGLAAGMLLLALAHPPTAIATATDIQAFGVYEAARRCGVRIPEELSVIGYDDVPTAKWLVPPLTTVRQPVVGMSEQAARILLDKMIGRVESAPRPILDVELVVRESTARPRST